MKYLFIKKNKTVYTKKKRVAKLQPSFFEQNVKVFKNITSITRLIYTLIFSVVISVYCFSQATLYGSIADAQTGEKLVGATISCKKLNTGTMTDDNGYYSLKLPKGIYSIEFSFVGYKSLLKKISLNNTPLTMNISLRENSTSLNEVVITGKTKARQIQEEAMPVSVIDIQKISSSASNINDVLAKTAGITTRNSGGVGSTSRISVRGLEGKRIGIFIDGLPMSDNNDYNDLNAIPVDIIKHIEIYKGIVPAKFGGSAIGGAVNIVLKEYPPYYLEAKYTYASYNTHISSVGLKHNFPDKGFMLGIGGGYTYSDNNYKMKLPLNKGVIVERDHDNYQKRFIGTSLSTNKLWFDEFELESAFISTNKEIQGVEYNIQKAHQSAKVFSILNKIEKDKIITEGLDLYMNNIYSYSVFKFIDTSTYRYQWDMTPYVGASAFGGEIGSDANSAHNKAHNFMQRTNFNYIFNNSSSINFNSQYNYIKNMPTDTLRDAVFRHKTTFNSQMHSWIGGVSYTYNSANKKLTNMLASKFYYYNMKGLKLIQLSSPETEEISSVKSDYGISNALRYRFSTNILAKVSLAYDVRLPNAQELLGDGFLIVPASDLQPEQNRSINLSMLYDKFDDVEHLQLELNLFYMKLTNMIRFVPQNMLQAKYENFGEMRSLGIEFDAKWDATTWLYLFANATYQDLRDTRKLIDGTKTNFNYYDRIPNIPCLMANAGIEMHKRNLWLKNSNSRLFINGSFIEEYYYKFRQSNYEEPKIPRSLVFNLGIEQSIFNGSVLFGLQINNLTNKKILSEFNRPMPGRNYTLKIRYIWKKTQSIF